MLLVAVVIEQLIFPGRFQPPHRDHVALAVRMAQELGPYWLGVVVQARPPVETADIGGAGASPVPAGLPPTDAGFAASAAEHHEPERNPLSFAQRHALWTSLLRRRLPADLRPRVIALPRPELAWAWIEALLPGRRAWIVPDGGDAFDDAKADFFRRRGDRVVRPRYRPITDGRRVRALLASGSHEIGAHVDTEVAAFFAAGKDIA